MDVGKQAKAVLGVDKLEAVADRGYFNSKEIFACEKADIIVTLPKPMTSGAKSDGRFGKQDFVYLADKNVYRCPAGEELRFYYANEERGQQLRCYCVNRRGTLTRGVMCGRRLHCKWILMFCLRSGASHVSGLLTRRMTAGPDVVR